MARTYIGISSPTRQLEESDGNWGCDEDCPAAATVVEFQGRIGEQEPPLASPSDEMSFYCDEHSPVSFDIVEEVPRRRISNTVAGRQYPLPPGTVFDRSFATGVPDFGRREDVQVGDVVTFFPDGDGLTMRIVAEVCGQLLVTEPRGNEKVFTVKMQSVTNVFRQGVQA